jgi:hypothetical protein
LILVTESNYEKRITFRHVEHVDDHIDADMIVDCGIIDVQGPMYLWSFLNQTKQSDYFHVPFGAYAARIFHFDLGTVNHETEEGDDFYQIDIWTCKNWPVRIVKNWCT